MFFIHLDGTEQVVGRGEAYYVPPGHRWKCLEDAETVEFSPADELEHYLTIAGPNLVRLCAATPAAGVRGARTTAEE